VPLTASNGRFIFPLCKLKSKEGNKFSIALLGIKQTAPLSLVNFKQEVQNLYKEAFLQLTG
jgi:hypothetical protein